MCLFYSGIYKSGVYIWNPSIPKSIYSGVKSIPKSSLCLAYKIYSTIYTC